MLSNRAIQITILISLLIHIVILAIPKFFFEFLTQKPKVIKEFMAHIVIKDRPLLSKIEEIEFKKAIKQPLENSKVEEIIETKPQSGQVVESVEVKEIQSGIDRDSVTEQVNIQTNYQPPVEPRFASKIDWANIAFQTYQKKVREKIEQAKIYPIFAQRNGIEGKVKVQFIILSDGNVKDIEVIESSCNTLLDQSAFNAIKRAVLFPPIPKEISESQIQMQINIVFHLE